MAGSDESDAPAWQQQQQQAPTDDQPPKTEPTASPTLDQARRFLSADAVRTSSHEKKAEFLKSKGLNDEDIQILLSEEAQPEQETLAKTETLPESASEAEVAPQESAVQPTASPVSTSSSGDAPPIITYPEFLTHSPRPAPLLTPTLLLNILTVSGTAWTLLYGAARFLVKPMTEDLAESRSDYYAHVNTKLSVLVEKLEGAVSEVPYKNGKPLKSEVDSEDDNSSYDDPTELFHRDVGTQTSPQATPVLPASESEEKAVDKETRQLGRLASSLKELTDMYTKRAENVSELTSTLHEVRDNIDKLAYPPMPDYSSMYGGTGFGMGGRAQEPDDEYKKTIDAIRSVKGVFLSSRSFPAVSAR